MTAGLHVKILTVFRGLKRWIGGRTAVNRHMARGRNAESLGRMADACRHYRDAVAADPGNADAHVHLGVTLEAAGDLASAIEAYEAALAADPTHAYAAYNLGKACFLRGEHARSEAMLRAALAAKPDFPEALVVLSSALDAQGDIQGAVQALESAIGLRPAYGGALRNLGLLQARLQNWDEAAAALTRATAAAPADAEAHCHLASVLAELGRREESLAHVQRALALAPRLADAHVALGNLHAAEQRYAKAAESYRTAIELDERHVQARVNLGNALVYLGDPAAARQAYDGALARDPENIAARWARTLCPIPAIRDADTDIGQMRQTLAAELAELDRWLDARRSAEAHRVVGVQQPFWLAYQARDNRRILQAYGALCARLMGEWQAMSGLVRPAGARRPGPVRVGVVSQYFRDHSVWNALARGWFQALDRDRFELHGFCLGTAQDAETRLAQSRAAGFVRGLGNLRQWVEAMLEAQPDVLLYPEVGMDPMTVKLASLRLAPVQAASWGHPETTGLPTIDHYLSAQDLEPDGAQTHYAEHLVALPHLGCYLEPEPLAEDGIELSRWDLPSDVPLLLCPGTPFKYAPEQDALFVEIARRLGRCRMCFFIHGVPELSERLRRRLAQSFAREGLDFERYVSFLPWLPKAQFHALMRRARLMLDTIGFSGFNTALQALACELPLVTCEGQFLRGRLASGLLKRMGLGELVAEGPGPYVELAVRLAVDDGYRDIIRRRIAAGGHTAYRDTAPIRALERFLLDAARG